MLAAGIDSHIRVWFLGRFVSPENSEVYLIGVS